MDRLAAGLRLEAITLPRQEIMHIWRTFRPVDRAFYSRHHRRREYTALIQKPTPTTQGIFVPNPFAVIRSPLSNLLGIPTQEVHQELHQGWDHGVRIAWLSDWTLLRALTPSTASYQRDACHGFLLLIFGTLLFPYAPNLIDEATAQVVLQAVGGHSFVEALLSETVRSLDYIREGASDGVSSGTRSNRNLRPGDGPPERYVRPSAGKGARDPPSLGLVDALILPSLGPAPLSVGH
ncbi:hypothetical protein CRG98_006880 [Punica granatum]|uniref:Aminotransferase-like plant mobile domain-containing protein n=1 Tax=Punica granatum TaxID=22663 RepID=A0A2I0KW72_PUNGR|nr:hypothetical protein CRG98_006880 [Punica granatum]